MTTLDQLLEELVPDAPPSGEGPPLLPPALGLEERGLLGEGASAWVVRAYDAALGREVAVKVARPGAEAALRAEAAITARLAHPAVLPVHRVVERDGTLFVEMRLAPGATLAALLADWSARPDEAWPAARRLGVLLPLASALARAHEVGVVHGDVHPGNICVGDAGEPYLLDWSGAPPETGAFTGAIGYACPAQLHGASASPAGDVHALGAVTWELAALRPFRPRRLDEPDGAFIARVRALPPPVLPTDCDEALATLLAEGFAERVTAAAFGERLAAILGSDAERARRSASAATLVDDAKAALTRFQEGERRLQEERRVATIQRAKVPGWAPVEDKRAAWEAEDRAAELLEDQTEAWVEAAERGIEAAALAPESDDAHAVLADLWWERMRTAEERNNPAEAAVAARRVRRHDRGRWSRVLDAPGLLTLTCPVPGARVRIARFDDEAVRTAHPVDERALPLERHPLPPGSYLLTVSAPGYSDARYPVRLDRVDHHRGRVELYTPAQIGDGWVQIPGGPFRMGGDPLARNAVDACMPTIGTRFVTRTCVTVAEYFAWLDVAENAAEHTPSEMALFSEQRPLTARGPDGRHPLPPTWRPDWPMINVSLLDARAYAAWRSAREGRPVRLLTEEEWEKASRGVDGRAWPWGNRFDPTFCQMRESTNGVPWPGAVGAFPVDESVYGVRDTAGGTREWTTSPYSTGQVVMRGGTWGDDADDCRCAGRAGLQPPFRTPWVSFRLVTEVARQ